MASYKLSIKRSAAKELETVEPQSLRLRIVSKIQALAKEPRPSGSEKLAGAENCYRIRQGDYRVLYTVDDQAVVVEVVRIAHRRGAYR